MKLTEAGHRIWQLAAAILADLAAAEQNAGEELARAVC